MNHTQNYNLNQWAKSDQVKMEDFNADNAKIDAAIKAEADARTALAAQVAQKASTSALNALSATVSGHTTTLGKKGNCQIYTTTYNGNGSYGDNHPNTLYFPRKPLLIFIFQDGCYMPLVYGAGASFGIARGGTMGGVSVTWSGNSVTWYSLDAQSQMNIGNYRVIALFQTD